MIVGLHRAAHFLHKLRMPVVPRLLYFIQRVLFGAAIPPSVSLGKNVLLGYQGLGTVIHARAVIGDDVTIGPGVTIGGRSGHYEVPVIERGAYIGTGAKILGPIKIGENAIVGANAVVLTNVEPNTTVVGIPAKPVNSGRDTA